MNGQDRERLSAVMDGEAGELELRQALASLDKDPELAARWSRWHLAQSALRGEPAAAPRVDLLAGINARLDAEPAAPARPAWFRPVVSVAVAASVTLATVFAWQAWNASTVPAGNAVADGQTVAMAPMVVVRDDGEELVVPAEGAGAAAPTAAQDRINAYLARHVQSAAGMASYARVVSLEGEQRP